MRPGFQLANIFLLMVKMPQRQERHCLPLMDLEFTAQTVKEKAREGKGIWEI